MGLWMVEGEKVEEEKGKLSKQCGITLDLKMTGSRGGQVCIHETKACKWGMIGKRVLAELGT